VLVGIILLENEFNKCGAADPIGHDPPKTTNVHPIPLGAPDPIGHNSPKTTKPVGEKARQCPLVGP
jgi:hypothetical protein